jgi:class 3 adenylate cyclase
VNKNIGDAFLCVWKLVERDEEEVIEETVEDSDANQGSKNGRRSSGTSHKTRHSHHSTASSSTVRRSYSHYLTGNGSTLQDALEAFLTMNDSMKTSEEIQKLAADPRLQKKLPGYTVRMGSGLHLGWAIEGAIGTAHKVDATYLSPHVNLSMELEAATKIYGVKILMSEPMAHGFSADYFKQCRAVDKVIVKGSVKPMLLYIHMPSESPELSEEQRVQFMDLWREAFPLYQTGSDWKRASDLMMQCLGIMQRDAPAKVLLSIMQASEGRAPADWRGYREL